MGSDRPQITRSHTAENQIGTWKGVFLWSDIYCTFSCLHLSGLLFIEELDWERVKKLGGKFLQLRLEDLARTYQGT
jgi:hypothetical protein